ncbi:MAG: VWA domain-containing protein [Planctomycetota bacterium]|nr:VWA domain-containing protein [Planctomycetota bacterium]
MRARRRTLLGLLLIPLSLLMPLGTEHAGATNEDPDRVRTEATTVAYHGAQYWAVRSLALLNLGPRWHPKGAGIVLDALRDKDKRLRVYAMEALWAMRAADLRVVLTPALVDELVTKQLKNKSKLYRKRVFQVLAKAFPEALARKPAEWMPWWRKTRETYAPPAWEERVPEPDPAKEGAEGSPSHTVEATSIVNRALDLAQSGVELVIVLDTTSSMTPTINAARAGLEDLVTLLRGLAPTFKLGLVHYRDRGELGPSSGPGSGADHVLSLTTKVRTAQKELAGLRAVGGGDPPERVESGIWHALQKKMRWSPEANKMIVVIGDAPPHDNALRRAIKLVTEAREDPSIWLEGKKKAKKKPAVTGGNGKKGKQKPKPRPFLTSCVAVGPQGAWPRTAETFKQIAEAGGGAYAELATQGEPRIASTELVSRLVEMSFGEKYVKPARRFVALYLEYAEAGYPMR